MVRIKFSSRNKLNHPLESGPVRPVRGADMSNIFCLLIGKEPEEVIFGHKGKPIFGKERVK